MNKYNDSLNNETEVQIISTYRRPLSEKTKNIIQDLGTVPSSYQSAVMFSNSKLNLKEKLKEKEKTLQQQVADNVSGSARAIPSEAFGPGVREEEKKIVGIRDLSPNQDYTQIEIQVCNIRSGRYKRADVYISFQTIDDSRYSIALVSNITNAFSEVKRNVEHSIYWSDQVKTLIDMNLDDLMIGRARYKQMRNRPLWQTKPNLGNVLVAYCMNDDIPVIMLYLFTDDPIVIPLDKELSEKQKKIYTYAGVWKKRLEDI